MKYIPIKRCSECPYYSHREGYCVHYGKRGDRGRRKVNNSNRLYSWCPLDDLKEIGGC